MLLRIVTPRALLLLAVVTLVVPTVVLGLYGTFQGYGADGERVFSWGLTAWLVGPYVAFAALLGWASRSAHQGFRIAVAVTAIVVVLQSVLLDVLTLNSDDALGAVGVIAMPVLYFGGVVVLVVVGLVLHGRGRREVSAGSLPGAPAAGPR